MAQLVKNPSAMWETWVGSLGWEDRSPGEGKGYPLQYSGLENFMGAQRVGHDWATFTLPFLLGYCEESKLYMSKAWHTGSAQLIAAIIIAQPDERCGTRGKKAIFWLTWKSWIFIFGFRNFSSFSSLSCKPSKLCRQRPLAIKWHWC